MPKDKDILIKIAVIEQASTDIYRRLDKIEKNLDSIKSTININVGKWKAVAIIGGLLSSILAFLRITKT